jgi:hypothetical protein
MAAVPQLVGDFSFSGKPNFLGKLTVFIRAGVFLTHWETVRRTINNLTE